MLDVPGFLNSSKYFVLHRKSRGRPQKDFKQWIAVPWSCFKKITLAGLWGMRKRKSKCGDELGACCTCPGDRLWCFLKLFFVEEWFSKVCRDIRGKANVTLCQEKEDIVIKLNLFLWHPCSVYVTSVYSTVLCHKHSVYYAVWNCTCLMHILVNMHVDRNNHIFC